MTVVHSRFASTRDTVLFLLILCCDQGCLVGLRYVPKSAHVDGSFPVDSVYLESRHRYITVHGIPCHTVAFRSSPSRSIERSVSCGAVSDRRGCFRDTLGCVFKYVYPTRRRSRTTSA